MFARLYNNFCNINLGVLIYSRGFVVSKLGTLGGFNHTTDNRLGPEHQKVELDSITHGKISLHETPVASSYDTYLVIFLITGEKCRRFLPILRFAGHDRYILAKIGVVTKEYRHPLPWRCGGHV